MGALNNVGNPDQVLATGRNAYGRDADGIHNPISVDGDGHQRVIGVLKKAGTVQAVAATGDYGVNDVLSNNATTGIPWNFPDVVERAGGAGYITKAQVTVETTAQAHRLTLYLFKETPTSELDDNKVNTGPNDANRTFYLGKIDFPALESLGAGNSDTLAPPSPTTGVPFAFECAAADVDLYGILVTRDAFTNEIATDDYQITLTIEQA